MAGTSAAKDNAVVQGGSGGKVAVVTGGGSGIGRAISVRLARDGIAVAVWDRDGASAEETADLIVAASGNAISCALDVASSAAIAEALARTHSALGAVTILVNNAAVHGRLPFLEITEVQWARVMNVNLTAPFLCAQAVLPAMLEAGWGRIVNIASSSAQTGGGMQSHYVASKAGVMGLTRALATEFADRGITVNTIPPGYVDTPMARAGAGSAFDAHAAASPMKRAGKPEEVAAACAFLVSDDAAYITGQTLGVNGGRVIC